MILHTHSFRSLQALGLTLAVFLPTLGMNPITVNAKQSRQLTKVSEDVDSYIIEKTGGRTTCRQATPAEVPSTRRRPDDIGVPFQNLISNAPENAVNGLTINFNSLSQLQSDPNRSTVEAAFQRAAAVWTARIKSPVTISIDLDYGPNLPGGGAFGTNVLGSTSSRRTLIDYPGARTNLIAGASSPGESAILNALPPSFLPTDLGNGSVVAVSRSVAFALGIPVSSPADLNVATMGFNKTFPYDFNPDDGITPGQTDFVAVAIHEIGHALGFSSGSGDGDQSTARLLDFFRFRQGTTTGTFPTAPRVMDLGGTQVYFTGESFLVEGVPTNELGFSTGGPNGVTTGGGDGRQSSHWKDDDLTGKYIGIMDPSIADGVHETTRENDFVAMEMIGWNLVNSVAPPPAPPPPAPPANDNFANAQIVSGCSGSVSGVNLAATHEAGEPLHFPPGGGGDGGGFRSVWYLWQAPVDMNVDFTTAGSRFDTVLAVYTGTSVGSLAGTLVQQSDDVGGTNRTSLVNFNAQAGKIYRIAVDGYNNEDSGGDFGPLTLNWAAKTTCSVAGASPQILLEQNGPAADQAAVVESIFHTRDPYLVVNSANLLNPVSDPNTKVVIFVSDLPGTSVMVNLIDSNNNSFDITPIDVHQFTEVQFSQITFRLPTGLAAGTCRVRVLSQSLVSNTATFRIQ